MSTPAPTAPPPTAPPADPNVVNVEVNGVPLKARKGQMIIEVTDQAEIYVPRFCYHPKLSIAANCRMCLVEVEKAPKPLPACATPVAEGMKIFTRSKRAISAQKATMEFLLINHPLDCPICDQGGECELQDLAMGFGRGVSRYTERKRIVKDKNLGPLVSTDMTRCIHCTRCVRFGAEIAGVQELGANFRSDRSEIGTYIEKSVDHELSGNIIDLCPVGALNNKPYRYSARAWEMVAKPLVSPHDCAGSNLYAHVFFLSTFRFSTSLTPKTSGIESTLRMASEAFLSRLSKLSLATIVSLRISGEFFSSSKKFSRLKLAIVTSRSPAGLDGTKLRFPSTAGGFAASIKSV